LIAAPLSLWSLKGCLSSFAYRVEIRATILIMAAALSVSIAVLTVGLKISKGCDE